MEQEDEFTKKFQDYQEKHFGRRYRGASLANSSPYSLHIQESLQRFLVGEEAPVKQCLVLTGVPGSGKTYVAAALVPWMFSRFNNFRVWKEQDLYSKLRAGIDSHQDFTQTLKFCSDDEMVILDDLGSNPSNEWRKEIIFNFLDMRYSNNLKTVITTNLGPREIEDKYGQRTRSRMFSPTDSVIIDFTPVGDLREAGY